MKFKLLLGIIFFTFLFIVSCKFLAFKKYAENYTISYGSSGGFTGAVNEFILKGDGSLSEYKSLSKDTVFLKTIAKKDLKNIIKIIDSKNLANIKLDEASNMNSFVRIYKNGNILHSFQWPQGKTDLPKELQELHTQLTKLYSK